MNTAPDLFAWADSRRREADTSRRSRLKSIAAPGCRGMVEKARGELSELRHEQLKREMGRAN